MYQNLTFMGLVNASVRTGLRKENQKSLQDARAQLLKDRMEARLN